MQLLITCEHGGNDIPVSYLCLFKQAQQQLQSHLGWDIGALQLAKSLAEHANYFYFATYSRLLVELNRSPHHPRLFSTYTKQLVAIEKAKLLADYYFPYRNTVITTIEKLIQQEIPVLHISVHSFTPVLSGKERTTDIGLLYDPNQVNEKKISYLWKQQIYALSSDFRVRFNYPYLGIADGFVTYLRRIFPSFFYNGIELEVNQKLLIQPHSSAQIVRLLSLSLQSLCAQKLL